MKLRNHNQRRKDKAMAIGTSLNEQKLPSGVLTLT